MGRVVIGVLTLASCAARSTSLLCLLLQLPNINEWMLHHTRC
jgi:hypothetical protein